MRLIALLLFLGLAACAGKPSLEDEKLSEAEFNLEEFFDGRVVATGQFQDVFGTVRRRFDVVINGTWDGETLTLVENFVYEDKSTEQRVWTLVKTGADTWRGSAPGVIGEATGEERGDTFNWQYLIDLPVPDGTLRVRFDDWMWQLSETRVLNRAYMKKYGVDIGEVIISFEKQ
ncbi:DUF3833 domain-containing protein [Sulfitobacter sp. SK012]|uniref:DUF3833 domain-containing protein n=1 Tax=Sulfitobacter sp. SK012 TaxID=1389005 RepID=UPI000E0BE8F6|nr:DUF3833 domain-containing protein [Sulfitobacter sp. SK012]AXI47663.1 DUF3833 domain-containing protein [Sulfitobacter sp. SK012]